MKKLSRIAALLAAGAALLMVGAGFVSCSEDDGEEDNSPKLTISADSAVSVEAGEAIDVVLTATLKNDSFAGAIDSGTDLSAYVTVTPSNAASFANDLEVSAAEDIAADGTTAKVRLTVTTTAEAVSGTIKVTIDGEALKSGKDLTSNALSYTIAGENAGGDSEVVAKTYNFVGLGFSAFPANSLTAKANGTAVLTELGSETQPYFATGTWTVADATVTVTNTKRISARFTDAATTAINIGNSNMASATAAAASNYIKITAPGAGTVKMTYKITASTAPDKVGATDATAALTSASAVLASNTYDTTYTTYSALTDEQKTANYNNQVLETTVTAGQEVYVGYFRGTDATTGNIDVYKIEFTPASAE